MKKAFTIIELLLAIFIVAVLVSIILPSLGKIKYTAQKTGCIVNLRSFGQSLGLYVTQYETLPLAHDINDIVNGPQDFIIAMSDFLNTVPPNAPWKCPMHVGETISRGISYEYTAGSFLADYGLSEHPNPKLLREVTLMYEEDLTIPILQDMEKWHEQGIAMTGKNGVFYDGHAGAVERE